MPDVTPLRSSRSVDHLDCQVRYRDRVAAWISVRGELDLASAPRVDRTVREAMARARLVIVDLRQLTFIDAAGLNLLVRADARARRSDRRLVIVRGSAQTDRLFTLLGLDDRLEIIDLESRLEPASPPSAPFDWLGVA